MAIRKARTLVATCDGCGKRQIVETLEEVMGYMGDARLIHTMGGTKVVDWLACDVACIKDAIMEAIDRDRQN